MPLSRQGRRARQSWPLWCGLAVSLVVAAGSCGVADERPPNPAAVPASSAERAVARAQRAARARAKAEQAPRSPSPKPRAEPVAKPAPPPPPPPTEPQDAGTPPDAGPVDAVPDASAVVADAGPPTTDAGPPDPAALCDRICDKVIDCMRALVGDMPPGMDEQRLTSKLRTECMDECTADIDEHAEEAAACLEIEDCSEFLDCIEDIDDD